MWTRVRAFLFLALLTVAGSASAGNPISGFQENVFQGGLSRPTAIAFLPDGRLLITEQGGALKLSNGTSVSTLINIPVCSSSEMGLLGVAVDPNFTTNGFVYLYRTLNNGNCASSAGRFNQVVRITIGPGDTVNPASLMQAELDQIEVEGTAGGGVVTVTLSAKGDLKGVKIDDSLLKPSEKEIVEDLIVAAHADARRKAEGVLQEKMKEVTGGLPLPPGLGLT